MYKSHITPIRRSLPPIIYILLLVVLLILSSTYIAPVQANNEKNNINNAGEVIESTLNENNEDIDPSSLIASDNLNAQSLSSSLDIDSQDQGVESVAGVGLNLTTLGGQVSEAELDGAAETTDYALLDSVSSSEVLENGSLEQVVPPTTLSPKALGLPPPVDTTNDVIPIKTEIGTNLTPPPLQEQHPRPQPIEVHVPNDIDAHPTPPIDGKPSAYQNVLTTDADRIILNYAATSSGALVLEKSRNSKGMSNILVNDKDKYAITPCVDKKWVVIGLSEDIMVKQFCC